MRSNRKFSTSLLLIILLSIVLRAFFLHPNFSDENFYFNVAKNIAEGKIPYRDFFFAHPPLQVYTLAILYKIFGFSFFIGKFLTLLYSSISILLLYFIIKVIYKEKSAFMASILFILSPPFIAFSHISYGMWETMAFLLLSLLLLFKKRTFLSVTFFVVAIFFRYVVILYLPLFLVLLYLRNGKISKFLLPFIVLLTFSILIASGVFGTNYINQTVFYHIFKTSVQSQTQYLNMSLFFMFLAIISALIGLFEKNKLMMTFALLPLAVDVLLLLFLKMTFYHYFLLSVPLYLIAFSKIFELRYKFLKFAVVALLILSLILNFNTLDFYLNPAYSKKFYYVADFIRTNTEKNDTIFGEPVMTNYVSLVTGREIAGGYLDSYVQHLSFEGIEKVVKVLSEKKPKIIVEMENYYIAMPEFKELISNEYMFVIEAEGLPRYLIYRIKS